MEVTFSLQPDEDTAAAIVAALACALAEEAEPNGTDALPAEPPRSAWASAERAERARRWSFGIVGM
jgi:hypothetical protein